MKTKIENNKFELSDAEALKHKNFDVVIQKAALAKSASKFNWKWIAGGTGVLAVLTSTLLLLPEEQPYTAAPANNHLSVKMIPDNTEGLMVENSSIVQTKDGSLLVFEENSLLDKNGKALTKPVALNFKEYHNVIDQILCKTPMTYDSAGTTYHFESAGMFDLSSVNNEIKINPEAPIKVMLNSKKNGTNYNLYQYNEDAKNWKYLSKDNTPSDYTKAKALKDLKAKEESKQKNEEKELQKLNIEKNQKEQEKPILPHEENKDRFHIKLDVNYKDLPELAYFKNARFEVLPNANFDPQKSKVVWDYVSAKKDKESYVLTFFKGKSQYEVPAVPVLNKAEYTSEKRKYEIRMNAYKMTIDSINEAQIEKSKRLEIAKKNVAAIIHFDMVNNPIHVVDENITGAMENEVLRTFTVSNFGTFNCDCPNKLPKEQFVKAEFKIDTNKAYFRQVYLVERNKKMMYTMYESTFGNFPFNPKNDNLIIGVDESGLVSFYEDFSAISDKKDFTFKMKPVNRQYASAKSLKEFFNL